MMKKSVLGALAISVLILLLLAKTSGAKEISGNRLTYGARENSVHRASPKKVDGNDPSRPVADPTGEDKDSVSRPPALPAQDPRAESPQPNPVNSNDATGFDKELRSAPQMSEQAQAELILQNLISQDPLLQGATVQIRECPHNWQGCVYYKSAEIWIDPGHKASLERILVHECAHITDWRTDGDIDNNDYHE